MSLKLLENELTPDDIVDLYRIQRHDFLNYLQIISGYLQLGKYDEAADYVKNVISEIEEEGMMTTLYSSAFALNLLSKVKLVRNKNVLVEVIPETKFENLGISEDEFIDIFNSLWYAVENSLKKVENEKNVIIEFTEEDDEDYCIMFKIDFFNDDIFSELYENTQKLLGDRGNCLIMNINKTIELKVYLPKKREVD